jgi:hypothetical protein
MNTKSPECYTTDPQAECLRVEIAPGRSLLLPLDQFVFAEFASDGKEHLLHLSFASHEIEVRGLALRRVETAIQELKLSFLVALPAKYYPLVPDGQPRIREIVVTETKPPVSQFEESHI